MSAQPRRVRIRVAGTVQGVGFRPFVMRAALELGLAGFVLNDEGGVVIEAEGGATTIGELVRRIEADAPPLADVESVVAESIAALGDTAFRIEGSIATGEWNALVSPDIATCDACLTELSDPGDRRFRYPFINCTDCGPRFSIVMGVPYDRSLTTMAGFAMCDACGSEYEDPNDRRFHAQPNACPACGPAARLVGAEGADLAGEGDPVARAAALLARGSIVAVKGIGGYHLACDAASEQAVAALRDRKAREDKPFALMASGLEGARELVELTEGDGALLSGSERPIVIARRRETAPVAGAVAPRSGDLGVMIAYSPLHHMLLADVGRPLVMTSANLSDEPIAYLDEDARERLAGIADAFLVHDRPIHVRTDDSVVRGLAGSPPLILRRSRGFVPRSERLPIESRPALGCGAELKSAFCVARGRRAWSSHHIGDLKSWETLESFRQGVEHFERLFAVRPQVIAHDLHPDYLSTRYALERAEAGVDVDLVGVQHHHAHLAACLAEHGETGRALGAVFDGTGYGADGSVWGGELLAGDLRGFDRVGMLMPARLPGGDRAVKEPWRMAAAWLSLALDDEAPPLPGGVRDDVSAESWQAVLGMVQTGAGSPVTTSMGRLFDAVAALCGVRARVSYEGQAAAELEGLADLSEVGAYSMDVEGGGEALLLIDPREAVRSIAADLNGGEPTPAISARFHNGLARATALACERACEAHGLDVVALSGGVFQNRLLLERTRDALEARGLRTLVPARLPVNDGGIAFGQLAVAAARLASDR